MVRRVNPSPGRLLGGARRDLLAAGLSLMETMRIRMNLEATSSLGHLKLAWAPCWDQSVSGAGKLTCDEQAAQLVWRKVSRFQAASVSRASFCCGHPLC